MKKVILFIFCLNVLVGNASFGQIDSSKTVKPALFKTHINFWGTVLSLSGLLASKPTDKAYFTRLEANFDAHLFKNIWLISAIGYWDNQRVIGNYNPLVYRNKGPLAKIGLEYIHKPTNAKEFQFGLYARQCISQNNVHSTITINSNYWNDYQEIVNDKFVYNWTELGMVFYFFTKKEVFKGLCFNINPELAIKNQNLDKNYRVKQIVGWGLPGFWGANSLNFTPRLRFQACYIF